MTPDPTIDKGAIALGTVLKALIVLFVVAAGYWYFTASRLPGPSLREGIPGSIRPLPPASQPPVTTSEKFSTQGVSDDPSALSKDVNATDLTNLDTEIEKIGTELGGL